MSWFFGIFGEFQTDEIEKISRICPQPLYNFEKENYKILAGGFGKTLYHSQNIDTSWVVCGVGISHSDKNFSLYDSRSWDEILSKPQLNTLPINGHYVAVIYSKQHIYCFTDKLGLRNIYISKTGKNIVFSTRLDWLAKFRGNCSFNLAETANRLFLGDMPTEGCIIKGIERLTAGGSVYIKKNNISILHNKWLPESVPNIGINDCDTLLQKFVSLPRNIDSKLSFGLSGGMDSRYLFSIINSSCIKDWTAFTFGSIYYPDSRIASEICKLYNIPHFIPEQPKMQPDEFMAAMREFAGSMQFSKPISAFLDIDIRNYISFSNNNVIVMDGGFGEILRRGLYNRLLIKGKKSILKKEPKSLLNSLIRNTGNTFIKDEVLRSMKKSLIMIVSKMLDTMPPAVSFGIENWLDLFSVRVKIAGALALEQSRLDSTAISLTPFMQPEIINLAFSLPLDLKINSKMMRESIRKFTPKLGTFPLVKDNIFYPYILPTKLSKAYLKFKSKLKTPIVDNNLNELLNGTREFVMDTVSSISVQNFDLYDTVRIKHAAESYYSGNKKYGKFLNHWLAFELFRQEIE
ncbi:MAG: Asparagine synthetase protein [Ignavibacteria bacterium]|nr:Asparagine synthetase protein [Ignavibacteria bacterium]